MEMKFLAPRVQHTNSHDSYVTPVSERLHLSEVISCNGINRNLSGEFLMLAGLLDSFRLKKSSNRHPGPGMIYGIVATSVCIFEYEISLFETSPSLAFPPFRDYQMMRYEDEASMKTLMSHEIPACVAQQSYVNPLDLSIILVVGGLPFQFIRFVFDIKTFSFHALATHSSLSHPLSGHFPNFQTHAGILKLSQSVIELLYHFFPLSIDSLSPENSLVYGEAPVLLESVNGKNAIGTIFGNSGSNGGSLIGFGAEQVILVRDDSVKKEVSGQIGKQALVLTLVECKGLEFQLFNEGNFEMATLCFERAGDSYKEKWAKAAGLRAAANRMDGSNSELARVSLTEAAEIFETIGKFEIAAKCFIQLKKYKRAGLLYLNNYEESKLRDAADCFSLAECWSIAAEVYYRANCVLKCLTVCTKGNLFEAGLQFIEKWEADKASDCDAAEIQVLKELKQEFLERCASHYHQIEDTKKILENGGYYEEASRTLLLYVLVNSLWTTGSKGWPLKKFSNKEELLTKSKLIAKARNDHFYKLICLEASSLSEKDSSLAEMGDFLATSQRLGHLGVGIMYLRKILDSHLKVKLAKYEQVEMGVLDSMKHAALMISRKRVSAQTLIYFWNTWREKILSILMYLGSIGTIHEKDYKDYEEFCLSYLGVCKTVQNSSFIYMLLNANAYWMKGICHRSLKTKWGIEKLDTLNRFYGGKSMFNQGVMSLHILEVTKGLMESKVFDREAPKALLGYSASSKQRFFGIICPEDSKMIFSEDMFKLRKTELCREITKEVIVNHFDLDIFWESFFEQFKDCIDSGIVRLSFLLQIRKSLGRTCQPNWSKMASYISPFHFSNLLERLLYLGSSWKPIYFTTKSSLLETLTCENWKLYSKSKSETDISLQAELCSLESFLAGFAHHILLGKKDTVEWFEKTDIAAKRNYPSLVLRLSILVCLVCINSRNRFGHLYEILVEDEISSLLPVEFRKILKLAKPSKNPLFEKVSKEVDYNLLSRFFAEVLKIIENPMVILYSGKKRPAFFCPDAIFIDMELITCREDILNMTI
ncbi:hypothetical protein C5167_021743 [Papaver somniferum]|uniref:Uncharacterized protein n=1 Tax=Papaver somniferum TaxID=3469 RepID=A0A4Y7JJZ6_PAPSO|nr:hypothetical protein C5167_021743 [Papaver somniferum]